MKISILFPVYNTAPFLRVSLNSILAQSEQDWELLAVDDRSTDESPHILAEYARLDNRIRVLKKKDAPGIAPSLRLAFHHCRGDLVTRMDSDDLMHTNKLAALKALLLQHGKGHVATALVEYFSKDNLGEGYRRYAAWLNELARTQRHFTEIYKECTVPSPCWMAWRSDLEAIDAFRYDVYPEDYDLCFRWYAAGFKAVALPEVLHFWRDHPTRTSRTNPIYLDNAYLDLKAGWFLKTDRQPQRPLVLWGAGRKGKCLARRFQQEGVAFLWVCNNPNKWGKQPYGIPMHDYQILTSLLCPQIIVAVASPSEQPRIYCFLETLGFRHGEDFFFFC